MEKRRHTKIAKHAYCNWQRRVYSDEFGNEISDWLEAELWADKEEAQAKEHWEQMVYATALSSMHLVTKLPVDEIASKTSLPLINDDRQRVYSLIVANLLGRTVDPYHPEDGYSETFGELIKEIFSRIRWIGYMH